MTFPVTGTAYSYDNRANRWRNNGNGQFIPESQVVSEMRLHQEATFEALEALTQRLYSGNINLPQWQAGVALELKDAHLAQAMFGAGGRANMTSTEWGRVGGTLADEYRYLSNFANDIANGNVSEAQALARIKQYGIGSQQSYWREYARQDEGTSNRSNPLYTVPGAGDTACHGNCKCTLDHRPDGWIDWTLNPAEHCGDCLALAAGSPYSHIA